MTKQELLVSRINLLSEEEVPFLLETATLMVNTKSSCSMPDCPHCGASSVIRYGSKCGKQRFSAKPVNVPLSPLPILSWQTHTSQRRFGKK